MMKLLRWREDNDSPTLTLKSNEIVIKQNNSPYLEIKTNNSKGFEEMTEGDSLNYSNPNSKTRRGRVGKGVAQTLDTGCEQPVFQNNIRRLTPLECERLQGFPDNWTQYGTEGIISDTQRYKMCGNAVTVNVVKFCRKANSKTMTKKHTLEYIAKRYDRIKQFVYDIDVKYFKLKGQYHEDITQDLFLKMYAEIEKIENKPGLINRFLDRLSDSHPFKLYNTVKNMYIDLIRRENKYVSLDDNIGYLKKMTEQQFEEQPEVILDSQKDIEEKIDDYVDSFYWFDKKVFNLYRYEFKNHTNNMSKATKLSVSTIYRTVKRCKVKINEKLKKNIMKSKGLGDDIEKYITKPLGIKRLWTQFQKQLTNHVAARKKRDSQ